VPEGPTSIYSLFLFFLPLHKIFKCLKRRFIFVKNKKNFFCYRHIHSIF